MLISNKQLLVLIQIARDSLQVYSSEYYFSIPIENRRQLLETITNQQDETLINIEENNEEENEKK